MQQKTGKLAWIGVKKFIKTCQQRESCTAQKVHHSKLKNLNLDESNIAGYSNVITNFSSHTLTSYERSTLNKDLNYSFLTSYFGFLQIQASFERIYQETRSNLCFKKRIELKIMVFKLYSKFKSGYFILKHQKAFNLDEGELKPITDFRQSKSIIVCKQEYSCFAQ